MPTCPTRYLFFLRCSPTRRDTLVSIVSIPAYLTWSTLCKSFPYYVGVGVSSRATCRSCGYQFNKAEIRIRTTLLCKKPNTIRPCQINLCLNLQCLRLQSFMKCGPRHKYLHWVLYLLFAKLLSKLLHFLEKYLYLPL